VLIRQAYALLPHVKITDLLLEVDRWTRFTDDFTHLKKTEPAKDRALLLTVILADAINLGLNKMAEACPGTSIAKLSWLSAWHIRDETYSKARAALVNHRKVTPTCSTIRTTMCTCASGTAVLMPRTSPATMYWSPPATLVAPNLRNLIGSARFADVPSGNLMQLSSPGITWLAANFPFYQAIIVSWLQWGMMPNLPIFRFAGSSLPPFQHPQLKTCS
jgi:hypothetical protein